MESGGDVPDGEEEVRYEAEGLEGVSEVQRWVGEGRNETYGG